MTKPQRHALFALVITAVGFAGLMVGRQLHPDSNLLGGFGPVFGPVYWLGILLLFLSGFRWIGGWLTRGSTKGEPQSQEPK